MPTDNHMIAGLPAWATDEEARETVEAMRAAGIDTETIEPASPKVWEWNVVYRFAIVELAAAITDGDRIKIKAARRMREMAEMNYGNNIAAAAIIGERMQVPDEYRYILDCDSISDVAYAAASRIVAAYDKRRAEAIARWRARERAERREAAKEDRKQVAAHHAASAPAIGAVFTALVPYRLSKKSRGVCMVENGEYGRVYVTCDGVSDGDQIKITGHTMTRSYGYRIVATAVRIEP